MHHIPALSPSREKTNDYFKRWFKIVAIGVVSKSNPAFLFVTLIG